MHRLRLLVLLCLAFALPGATAAQDAAGATLLVEGLDPAIAESGSVTLDLDDLKALPATEFETSTIWTDGVHRFTGVALSDLFASLGGTGDMLRAKAINDYVVDIPMSDAVPGGPIVAYHMDGEPMPLRGKGPYWIVYPYDSDKDYRSELIYSRSIWQLSAIRIDE